MSISNRQELLLAAIEASLKGGKAILEIYNSEETIEVMDKDDKSPLTAADTASHQAIMDILESTDVPVLSEEGKSIAFEERSQWNALWVVDPLDGTKEFIKRNGEFTVNVALVEKGVPTMGVIYVPVTNTLYYGDESTGAYKVERIDANTEYDGIEALNNAGIRLPEEQKRGFTVVGSRSHMNDETREYMESLEAKHGAVEVISRGSSLKICMVVEGSADEYPRFAPTMEWDTAAGHALVRSVGKEMVNPKTQTSLEYNKEDLLNPHFLVRSVTE